MRIIINHSSMTPIYEQIVEQVKTLIRNEKLKENDNLPSVRSLAKELKISALTVKKAYDNLESEGFTVTVHGKGTYVAATNPELLLEEQKKELEADLEQEVTGDFEFNGGFDAMRQLLSHPLRPQAVFTGNDAMAVGVYQALYQAELQVPQDIAVIGYDDIELASFMTPPLTTIHQPKDELGELAIDVLIHRITQPTLQQQRLQLTPILMERGSA